MTGNFGFRWGIGLSRLAFFGSFWATPKRTMENKFETGC